MIVKFWTRFDQFTMQGVPAVALVQALGHTGTVPGAVLAADLPAALAQLEHTLETSGHATPGYVPPPEDADESAGREHDPPVALRTRAIPLVSMMRDAIRRGSDLMWDHG